MENQNHAMTMRETTGKREKLFEAESADRIAPYCRESSLVAIDGSRGDCKRCM